MLDRRPLPTDAARPGTVRGPRAGLACAPDRPWRCIVAWIVWLVVTLALAVTFGHGWG
jgi:hypothetical protein